MFHFICFSFQAARLITLVIMSLNASKSSSYAVMGLDIVNALVGMACTAYIMYMCKVNPRRIAPEKVRFIFEICLMQFYIYNVENSES